MASLAWNEVRDKAVAFSRGWAAATSEHADKQSFWNDFFAVFGRERRTVGSFEVAVKNIRGKYSFIDLLWTGVLLVEHKSAGKSLSAAESQAFEYIADLLRENPNNKPPRYVILSDFKRIALYDLEPDEQTNLPTFAGIHYDLTDFPLSELHRYMRRFAFIKGERTVKIHPEDPANEEAYARMSQLHRALEAGGFTGSDLEKLLVRILFCLFAEDTGVFEPNAFSAFIREKTGEDGGDLGARLNELFHYLNTDAHHWPATAKETFGGFKYVNGRLFADSLAFASFNREMRDALLAAADFQWARVSPAVFGSLFQGIMEDKTRRQQGAHYTCERDIMKVIRSLFLDDLRAEFEARRADRSTGRLARLTAFHDKLRSLRFLDPACGCGNFLVLSYRELRLLELDVLRELHSSGQRLLDVRELIKVDVDQFFGIELGEWPVRIAEVALWLMDHQMNLLVSEAFGQTFERLPLRSTPHIVQGNALRLDWREVLPPAEGVYVLGNPPFVGKHLLSAEQQADMELIWGAVKGAGILDYVTCWYRKAAEYVQGTHIAVAFVSTNSISQGEQVGVLWSELFTKWKMKIHFAHRTFPWMSEARGKAHVHVVIIGFGSENPTTKSIYDYDHTDGHVTVSQVVNASPYLVGGNDTFIIARSKPLCAVPEMIYGSKPTDGGHLIVEAADHDVFIAQNKTAAKYLRPYCGAEEFINGLQRWCLWLKDASPEDIRNSPGVMKRIESVRAFRSQSKKEPTRRNATTPSIFAEQRQPMSDYLLVPSVSSERRNYVPIGYMTSECIASNLVFVVPNADYWLFGVVTSGMHMAWMRTVCGRLKSDYRYSNTLVYNNFPWPTAAEAKQRAAVESAAQAVLDARAPYLPPQGKSTLADLYDPLTMPAPLAKAHAELDRAVDRCYRREPFRSDRERVEHLFALYEALTSPLLPAESKRAKRARGGKRDRPHHPDVPAAPVPPADNR